jgi:plastocyanin
MVPSSRLAREARCGVQGAREGIEMASRRRAFVWAGTGAAAAVTAMLVAFACGGGTSYGTTPTTTMPGTTGGGTTPTADLTITIVGMNGANSYNPATATVKAGQTVAWHNADTLDHTATGNGFDTGVVASGMTSAPIRFDAPGTLDYHCTIHPSMTGVLTVTQ